MISPLTGHPPIASRRPTGQWKHATVPPQVQPRFSAEQPAAKQTPTLLSERLGQLSPQLESTTEKSPNELQVGMWARQQKKFSNLHRYGFAWLTGDDNHLKIDKRTNKNYAQWYAPIVPGFLVVGMLPVYTSNQKLLGRDILMSKIHDFAFVSPITVNDTVTCVLEITQIRQRSVRLKKGPAKQPHLEKATFVTVQSDIYANDKLASTGEISVMLPIR